MEFITTNDRQPMTEAAWKTFEDEIVLQLTDSRNVGFEWNAIKTAVKAADGVAGPGSSNRHYVPYQKIRNALNEALQGKTRKEACDIILDIILHIYDQPNAIFSIDELKPPPYGKTVGESLDATRKLRQRGDMALWVTWALEAICDYPDNIFFGPGTGDKQGTKIDLPTDPTKGPAQLARVQGGAKLLYDKLSKNLKSLIDANGKKI